MTPALVVVPSVTKLPPETRGAVLVGGSHGAVYAAYLSALAGARAAIHHDAGIGRDEAGVSGLDWAERHGMAMAAVATATARIGDGADMLARGRISRANPLAAGAGVAPGMTVAEAVERLKARPATTRTPDKLDETRFEVEGVVCVDSISLAGPADRGRIVASGSHGGLPAGETAAKYAPRLSLFNDAGFGADRAGSAGLAVLQAAGLAGVTVQAMSARIGDGRSTLTQGIVSDANALAIALGARIGGGALELARRLADKSPS
ncbi:MAG: hypothetical protein FJX02_09865 [Alphaproteobacteria bacterium]|nr:hypothetical protein [Alphaproteobacteria bacterium]